MSPHFGLVVPQTRITVAKGLSLGQRNKGAVNINVCDITLRSDLHELLPSVFICFPKRGLLWELGVQGLPAALQWIQILMTVINVLRQHPSLTNSCFIWKFPSSGVSKLSLLTVPIFPLNSFPLLFGISFTSWLVASLNPSTLVRIASVSWAFSKTWPDGKQPTKENSVWKNWGGGKMDRAEVKAKAEAGRNLWRRHLRSILAGCQNMKWKFS